MNLIEKINFCTGHDNCSLIFWDVFSKPFKKIGTLNGVHQEKILGLRIILGESTLISVCRREIYYWIISEDKIILDKKRSRKFVPSLTPNKWYISEITFFNDEVFLIHPTRSFQAFIVNLQNLEKLDKIGIGSKNRIWLFFEKLNENQFFVIEQETEGGFHSYGCKNKYFSIYNIENRSVREFKTVLKYNCTLVFSREILVIGNDSGIILVDLEKLQKDSKEIPIKTILKLSAKIIFLFKYSENELIAVESMFGGSSRFCFINMNNLQCTKKISCIGDRILRVSENFLFCYERRRGNWFDTRCCLFDSSSRKSVGKFPMFRNDGIHGNASCIVSFNDLREYKRKKEYENIIEKREFLDSEHTNFIISLKSCEIDCFKSFFAQSELNIGEMEEIKSNSGILSVISEKELIDLFYGEEIKVTSKNIYDLFVFFRDCGLKKYQNFILYRLKHNINDIPDLVKFLLKCESCDNMNKSFFMKIILFKLKEKIKIIEKDHYEDFIRLKSEDLIGKINFYKKEVLLVNVIVGFKLLYEDNLRSIFISKKYHNLFLQANDKKSEKVLLKCHKEVLFYKTNFFYKMCQFGGIETGEIKEKQLVQIDVLDSDLLLIALEYFYTKQFSQSSFEVLFKLMVYSIMFFENDLKKYLHVKFRLKFSEIRKKKEWKVEFEEELEKMAEFFSQIPEDIQNEFFEFFEVFQHELFDLEKVKKILLSPPTKKIV